MSICADPRQLPHRPAEASTSRLPRRTCSPHAKSAAADLEFETAARLRDELKRLKLMDLEFANDLATPAGRRWTRRSRSG